MVQRQCSTANSSMPWSQRELTDLSSIELHFSDDEFLDQLRTAIKYKQQGVGVLPSQHCKNLAAEKPEINNDRN